MMHPQELQAERLVLQAERLVPQAKRLLLQTKRLVLDRRKQQILEQDFRNPSRPWGLGSYVELAWPLFRATPEFADHSTCYAGLTTHSRFRPHWFPKLESHS
jgi:hypothetical protein